jgi:plastocyanin
MSGFDMFASPKLLFRFILVVPVSIVAQKSVEDIDWLVSNFLVQTQYYQPKLSTDLTVESSNPIFLYNGLLSKLEIMKKNTSLFNIFSIFTLAAIVLLLVGTASTISMQSTHAQLQGLLNNQTDTSQNPTKTIQISVIEEEEVYRWANIQGTNPTLKFLTNANNTVLILNPTNEKHEMIIESNGNEVASSGDVARSSSGQLFFTPNMTETFEYYCKYHPDTMKGIVLANQQ